MKVVGLYVVRDEVDIIETNLRHHLCGMLDEAIVMDNGSSDGTLELLDSLADELPVVLARESDEIRQSERVTRMARLAHSRGADWVLPIDADEFWTAANATANAAATFRGVLEETPEVVEGLSCEMVTFVQRRDVLAAIPGCLATMVMTPGPSQISPEESWGLLHEGEIGFVELAYAPKGVRRSHPELEIALGNHVPAGPRVVPTEKIVCLHAPIRARSIFAKKLNHGRRRIEEQRLRYASLHLQRWWQEARHQSFEGEWEACSYEDGAITVAGTPHPLVTDERLRDLIRTVAPKIRSTPADATSTSADLAPPIGSYLFALNEVPGRLAELDFRILVELDRVQCAHGMKGDLLEIGVGFGKTAILLGYLPQTPDERLVACDVFDHPEAGDRSSGPEPDPSGLMLTETAFRQQYERFHAEPPEVIAGPSSSIDAAARRDTCRLVHLDGNHRYESVRHDAGTARELLGPGGIAVFGDVGTPAHVGGAVAAWEAVLRDAFVPLVLTDDKLYGTWDPAEMEWAQHIDAWVATRSDVECEIDMIAGWPVRRVAQVPLQRSAVRNVIDVPSLPDLDQAIAAQRTAAASPSHPSDSGGTAPPSRARRLAQQLAPPITAEWYRRIKVGRAKP